MFNRILATAIVAGALTGVFVFTAHMVKVVPLIQAAEVYENRDQTPALEPHSSEHADTHHHNESHDKALTKPEAHSHGEDEWSPDEGLERAFYTLLTDLIVGVGFGLMLTAIIAIRGDEVDWQNGILWGLGAFCAVTAFPALGLAPEMPGMQAAALLDRHIWWGATVAASSTGLGLMFLAKNWIFKIAGGALILIPHIFGAPHVKLEAGIIPVELGSEYAAATLVITLFFWIVLGGLIGYFYPRFGTK
jgi:cobalt transporter subunit CbtA